MEGQEIKNAGQTLLNMIMQQGKEREEKMGRAGKKAANKAVEKPMNKAKKQVKKSVSKAARKAKKKFKDKVIDAKKNAANKADETVTRAKEKATEAAAEAAAPATFGASAVAGKGAVAMQEAGLQARKAGREVAAKSEKCMTDNVADMIAKYSKPSGMALISGDIPGLDAKSLSDPAR